MATHSLWSPSSLNRRMHCPGSANAEDGLPEEVSRISAEGSARHSVREAALVADKHVEEFIGEILEFDGFKFAVDQEWARTIQPGINFIRELGGELYVEIPVDLSTWMPGESGTLDTAVVVDRTAYIIDGKFGRDPVDAYMNEQLMAYALGFWQNYLGADVDFTDFVLIIDQPYSWGRGNEWRTTLAELLEFGDRMVEAFNASKDPAAPRIPSPKACHYCKASPHCRESAQVLIDLFEIDAEGSAVIPETDRLSTAQLGAILNNAKLIKKNLEKYADRAKYELKAGNPVPGQKLVEGAGTREWSDEVEATSFLAARFPRDKIYNCKLISPAQAENLLGTRLWAKAQKLISKKDSDLQLVPESDSRPAATSTVALFDQLDVETDELDDLIFGDVEAHDEIDDLV